MRKPIVVDCNKQSDSYCIRLNPGSAATFKPDPYRPSTIFIGFDFDKVPTLSILQWKILCKGLFNFKKIIPCIVKQVGTRTVYFRWPHKTVGVHAHRQTTATSKQEQKKVSSVIEDYKNGLGFLNDEHHMLKQFFRT